MLLFYKLAGNLNVLFFKIIKIILKSVLLNPNKTAVIICPNHFLQAFYTVFLHFFIFDTVYFIRM